MYNYKDTNNLNYFCLTPKWVVSRFHLTFTSFTIYNSSCGPAVPKSSCFVLFSNFHKYFLDRLSIYKKNCNLPPVPQTVSNSAGFPNHYEYEAIPENSSEPYIYISYSSQQSIGPNFYCFHRSKAINWPGIISERRQPCKLVLLLVHLFQSLFL